MMLLACGGLWPARAGAVRTPATLRGGPKGKKRGAAPPASPPPLGWASTAAGAPPLGAGGAKAKGKAGGKGGVSQSPSPSPSPSSSSSESEGVPGGGLVRLRDTGRAVPRLTGPVNLVLIGGRGCGKSSIARRVALAERRFVPLAMDDLICYEGGGRTIPAMVEADGWGAFRDVEHVVAQKCGAFDAWALIDAGGGVVVDLDAGGGEVFSTRKLDALRGAHGALIVYVERDVEYLSGRVAGDANRPDLSAVQSFEQIVRRREPWYLQFCDAVLDGRGVPRGSSRGGDKRQQQQPGKKVPKKDALAEALLEYYYWETGVEAPQA